MTAAIRPPRTIGDTMTSPAGHTTTPEPPFDPAWREWLEGFTDRNEWVPDVAERADLEEAFKDGYSAGMAWQQVHGPAVVAGGRGPADSDPTP